MTTTRGRLVPAPSRVIASVDAGTVCAVEMLGAAIDARQLDVRPMIGVSGRTKRAGAVEGFPPSLADSEVDVYVRDYARAVSDAGGLPVHLPGHMDPVEYADRLDGIMLSGGADVSPDRYGAQSESDVTQLSKRLQASIYFDNIVPAGGERIADKTSGVSYYRFQITGKVVY